MKMKKKFLPLFVAQTLSIVSIQTFIDLQSAKVGLLVRPISNPFFEVDFKRQINE